MVGSDDHIIRCENAYIEIPKRNIVKRVLKSKRVKRWKPWNSFECVPNVIKIGKNGEILSLQR